jgi:glutathione S-transferase
LTVADFVTEIHDTHHPIASALYYHQQKAEARRRTKNFRAERMPKFLGYFEQVLSGGGTPRRYLAGGALSYADLSVFQLIAGLRYAFPRTMRRIEPDYPGLVALHERIAARPNIASYLASKRRIPFNQDGIFRHYPELDG